MWPTDISFTFFFFLKICLLVDNLIVNIYYIYNSINNTQYCFSFYFSVLVSYPKKKKRFVNFIMVPTMPQACF